jgi:hypothetical protein
VPAAAAAERDVLFAVPLTSRCLLLTSALSAVCVALLLRRTPTNSVRETLSSYEDPTVMYQLQRELAVKEERFEDARQFQQHIMHEMTHNR